jgi:hypothetical protein
MYTWSHRPYLTRDIQHLGNYMYRGWPPLVTQVVPAAAPALRLVSLAPCYAPYYEAVYILNTNI